jgi:TRAP-type C4-dicarboxylate transport system permease small subunit
MSNHAGAGGKNGFLCAALVKVNHVCVVVSALVLIAMSVMLSYDVFCRYVFNAPLPASVEISSLMQAYVVFLPFAFTLALGQHVNVTMITSRLGRRVQKILSVFSLLVTGVICVILAAYAWEEFASSYAINEIMMAPVLVYWWVGKFAAPVGMVVFGIQAFAMLVRTISAEVEASN